MHSITENYIKPAVVGDADCWESLLNKIVFVELQDGTRFSNRLVAIDGNLLIFKGRSGRIFADDKRDIKTVHELRGAV
jgi:hypothetical protein